jgi:hypothetical protein
LGTLARWEQNCERKVLPPILICFLTLSIQRRI